MAEPVGIDLGTSQCRAYAGGRSVVVPAVVAIDSEGDVLVGEDAVAFADVHPERTVFSVKRLLGRKVYSPEVRWFAGASPVELVPNDDGDAWIRMGERRYSPQEVVAYILRDVVERLDEKVGELSREVVITIPALFGVAQRRALRDAAEIAGLSVLRFVESCAAALLEVPLTKDSVSFVVAVDFGAGYFDACALQRQGETWEVIGAEGDTMLGGDDLDRRIVDRLISEFHEQHGADLTQSARALRRLWKHTQKMRLGAGDAHLPDLATVANTSVGMRVPALSSRDLDTLWADELGAFWAPCVRLFSDLVLGTDDIHALVFLGGAVRTPSISTMLAELFRREPLLPDDSELLAAKGAARLASRLARGEELIKSFCPYTLSVKARGGRAKRIIARNGSLPCTSHRLFATPRGGQKSLVFEVYQGEAELCRDNLYLGRFRMSVGFGKRHLVRFSLDHQGILNVSAEDASTGSRVAVDMRFSSGFSHEERARIAARLADAGTLELALERSEREQLLLDLPKSEVTPKPLVPTTLPPPPSSDPTSDAPSTEPPRSPPSPRRRGRATPIADGSMVRRQARTLPSRAPTPPPEPRVSDPSVIEVMDGESLVGATLGGRYVIDDVIAEGGMGRVYHARHAILDKEFAVKVIHPELAGNESVVERFLREANAAARIKSDHVVQIIDFGKMDDGTSYIVMEYLQGRLLADELALGALRLPRMQRIACELATGLAAAHKLEIVHRDLKPDNVLLSVTDHADRVKILDFGIAKSPTSDGHALTLIDCIVGTPHYMAPEQVRGTVDGRTDIYALGIVMYQMVTGEVPFDHKSVALLLNMQRSIAPRPPSTLPGVVCPKPLEDIILKCLEKPQASRFQRAEDVKDALAMLTLDDRPS